MKKEQLKELSKEVNKQISLFIKHQDNDKEDKELANKLTVFFFSYLTHVFIPNKNINKKDQEVDLFMFLLLIAHEKILYQRNKTWSTIEKNKRKSARIQMANYPKDAWALKNFVSYELIEECTKLWNTTSITKTKNKNYDRN